MPAKAVFLTDGSLRPVKIGNLTIAFKKTTPKNMKTAGSTTGLVIQALRYLGKEHVTEREIEILRRQLSAADRKRLLLDKDLAPAWIRKVIERVSHGRAT